MGWGATEEDEGVKAAIAQFELEQDAIKVTWLHTPENYLETLLTDIAAGTPPDTAFVGGDDYRTFIRDGLLLDITDKLTADPLLGRRKLLHRAAGARSLHAGWQMVWHRLLLGRPAHLLQRRHFC